MSIAEKLRDVEASATGNVLARSHNRDLKTCRSRQEMTSRSDGDRTPGKAEIGQLWQYNRLGKAP